MLKRALSSMEYCGSTVVQLPDIFGSMTLADCFSVSPEQLAGILEDAAKTGHFDFTDHHAPPKAGRREFICRWRAQYGATPFVSDRA